MSKVRQKWTKEKAIKIAKKHKTIVGLINANHGCYLYIHKNKLKEEAFSHMQAMKTYWTKEAAFKEARKYNKRSDLINKNPACYQWLRKHNLQHEALNTYKPTYTVWDKESALKEAKKYSNQMLKKRFPHLKILTEYKIPRRDNKAGKVDIFIQNNKNKEFIIIELKHDQSWWAKKEIKSQIAKYNRAFRERKGFQGVFVFSSSGKYGLPVKNLPQFIAEKLSL